MMQVRAPLMIEHRLIEKMLRLVKNEAARLRESKKLNAVFIDNIVDFVRIYADETHHGKEEQILFRDLEGKDMTSEEKRIMDELIEEHVAGRRAVAGLVKAKEDYFGADSSALLTIVETLEHLVDFYPRHIAKEDKVFFPSMMKYYTEAEQQRLLAEFWEFDRGMIHKKYEALLKQLSGQ